MSNVTIQKRGKYYQYKFEVAKVDGKRKFINKSGFDTKDESIKTGNIAYTEYLNTGLVFKEKEISYSDYLDYWYDNYCEANLKYNTRRTYKTIMDKYLKPELGKYRLSYLTSVKLNSFIVELCNKYNFKKAYYNNILKVLKNCFRIATDVYGFILYSLGKKSILNACKKNPHFIFHEYETLSEEIKLILFMVKSGDISENTGLEMMDKFNVPSPVIKAMLKINPKWREYILDCNKLDFGSADDQLMIANNSETDEETLYELSLVAKNTAVRKAILAHHNCTLEMAGNMFK